MGRIVIVFRRRRLAWFGHVNRSHGTEHIRVFGETKMGVKRPKGRSTLRWKDTVRRVKKERNVSTRRTGRLHAAKHEKYENI